MQDKDPCTLVLDIGKSNAKLVLIDAAGEVIARAQRANESVAPGQSRWQGRALPYRALGVVALQDWLLQVIPALPQRERIARISITTHGAAFCALGDDGLLIAPIDYEWDGYGEERAAFEVDSDPFAHTGSPHLPQGLNAGLQLHWLQRQLPDAWRQIRCWLPYPQYWAWWFSGVAASEVSSLGCHTGLWSPQRGGYSDWAERRGIATLFAPMRAAWDVLGPLRPELARSLGLAETVEVHCGSHDSNACLARYLCHSPDATVLSTGTWTLAMAAGAPADTLHAGRDQLVNVAVNGEPVPTARFMGGREFAVLCAGADPALAIAEALQQVLDEGWLAQPGFAASGGPFVGRAGAILQRGVTFRAGPLAVPATLRPALAALYCAEVSAYLLQAICAPCAAATAVVLEGPMAHDEAFCLALAALLAPRSLSLALDPLEGTARGAWLLAQWAQAPRWLGRTVTVALPPPALIELIRLHARAALAASVQ
jgi:sugar (pentulose or hexulose) kinase